MARADNIDPARLNETQMWPILKVNSIFPKLASADYLTVICASSEY